MTQRDDVISYYESSCSQIENIRSNTSNERNNKTTECISKYTSTNTKSTTTDRYNKFTTLDCLSTSTYITQIKTSSNYKPIYHLKFLNHTLPSSMNEKNDFNEKINT